MHILLIEYNIKYLFLRKKFLKTKINKILFMVLAILSIKKEMLEELIYKNLISNFAYQKARKIDFK